MPRNYVASEVGSVSGSFGLTFYFAQLTSLLYFNFISSNSIPPLVYLLDTNSIRSFTYFDQPVGCLKGGECRTSG